MSSHHNKLSLTINTELRHLPAIFRGGVSRILDLADSWKDLATIIKKPDTENDIPLFSANDISLLEDQKYRMSGSPTQALIEHWSTFGRKRPTIGSFLELLKSIHLYQAADYLSIEVLKGEPVERLISPIQLEARSETSVEPLEDSEAINLPQTNIPHISFHILKDTTRNFNDTPIREGGCKLGAGAFGDVYLGFLPQMNENVAIKVIKEAIKKQFLTELETLSTFIHENLLSLIGYSVNGPKSCLIYKYMQRGSLMDNLSITSSERLLWRQRIIIAFGTAQGINHLHTFRETPYVHRDIKSANILLDQELNPKVGDFGLVRMGSNRLATTCAVTTNVIGTPTYMAPEAFRGDISVKLDTFSYGVVLFELLTSLKPQDPEREESDILSYIEEHAEEIDSLLDNDVGPWDTKCSDTLFKLAFLCTKDRKKDRPTITEILPQLEELYQFVII